jgi:hypothetical protein
MIQYGYEMKLEEILRWLRNIIQKISFIEIFHNDKILFFDDKSLFLPINFVANLFIQGDVRRRPNIAESFFPTKKLAILTLSAIWRQK